MSFQLSENEFNKFRIAWLACKDIKSQDFINGFKKIWLNSFKEIESFFTMQL